jgi:hypothetical protein
MEIMEDMGTTGLRQVLHLQHQRHLLLHIINNSSNTQIMEEVKMVVELAEEEDKVGLEEAWIRMVIKKMRTTTMLLPVETMNMLVI